MSGANDNVAAPYRAEVLALALVLKTIGGPTADELLSFLAEDARSEVARCLCAVRLEPSGRRRARLLNLAAVTHGDARGFLRPGVSQSALHRRILADRPPAAAGSENSNT